MSTHASSLLQFSKLVVFGHHIFPAVLVPITMDFLYLEYPMFTPVFNSRYAALSHWNIIELVNGFDNWNSNSRYYTSIFSIVPPLLYVRVWELSPVYFHVWSNFEKWQTVGHVNSWPSCNLEGPDQNAELSVLIFKIWNIEIFAKTKCCLFENESPCHPTNKILFSF